MNYASRFLCNCNSLLSNSSTQIVIIIEVFKAVVKVSMDGFPTGSQLRQKSGWTATSAISHSLLIIHKIERARSIWKYLFSQPKLLPLVSTNSTKSQGHLMLFDAICYLRLFAIAICYLMLLIQCIKTDTTCLCAILSHLYHIFTSLTCQNLHQERQLGAFWHRAE